jgi:hypothetical protein
MAGILPVLGLLIGLLYYQEVLALPADDDLLRLQAVRASFIKISAALLLVAGIVAWWLVLTHKSRQVAQEESNRQTELLMREIESHRRTDACCKSQGDRRPGQSGQEPLHLGDQP